MRTISSGLATLGIAALIVSLPTMSWAGQAKECSAAMNLLTSYASATSTERTLEVTRPEISDSHRNVAWLGQSWAGVAPSRAHLERFLLEADHSLFECAAANVRATELGYTVYSDQPPSNARFNTIRRLGMPVFDRSGKRALMLVQGVAPGLGGDSHIVLLKREGAVWTVVGRRMLGLS